MSSAFYILRCFKDAAGLQGVVVYIGRSGVPHCWAYLDFQPRSSATQWKHTGEEAESQLAAVKKVMISEGSRR